LCLMARFPPIFKFLIVAAALMVFACAGNMSGNKQASGVYHRVKKGETLYKIAQAYHMSLQQIAEANNIGHADVMEAGRVLFIPDAQEVAEDVLTAVKEQDSGKIVAKTPAKAQKKSSGKVDKGTSPPNSAMSALKQQQTGKQSLERDKSQLSAANKLEVTSKPDKTIFPLRLPSALQAESDDGDNVNTDAEQPSIQRGKMLFLWPVSGKIVSKFGIQRNGMFFNGINIAAPEGSTVIAAADGTVIFSANLRDYGETIILKHDNDYASVYTQLGQRLAKRDDHVKKGDKIAILSSMEARGEAVLIFEIRYKNKARNPLFFLP